MPLLCSSTKSVNDMNKQKTILVLGGFGFIGTNIIDRLRKDEKYKIIVFEFTKVLPRQKHLNDIKTYYGDFSNKKDIEVVFKENKIDIVIHLIATTVPSTSNENMVYDVSSNAIGTLELLNLMKTYHVTNIVYLSSGGTIYGIPQQDTVDEESPTNPICSYGIVKLAIEKYIHLFKHLYNINHLILRASNPYGPFHTSLSQGLINVFLSKIIRGETITVWGDGKVVRDYLYAGDLAEIVYNMITKDIWNDTYNIGSGAGHSINEILKIMENKIGEVKVAYAPKRKFDVPKIILNVDKLKKQFSIKFTSLEDGILLTHKYHKHNQ